jgi:predicted RNA-binding protein with PUA-like domain
VSSNLALKNLREVRMGDQILIYHTGSEKAIVGLAEAITDACPDPKQQDEKAIVVSIKPKRRFPHSATLAAIKLKEGLKEFELTRLPQLSVMPVGNEHWDLLMEMLE